ncbi:hypothetical protein [Ignicoccus hospitalis]|uniref:Holin n=1 Tax=Ignicoccus hospitalis (strain KIN4/I / DSM 18386 / JCM 14125) TaxID=453591 RepID=A8ABC4_IGNH4|nr:hypothetical protein [Ignicoccus hospitalis]ABU82226.1 hypothetical protein Igni_1048 [Ignicoccus hospitalis KIN4/I]HIH90163.1 hypothetical protein [Desulfurococcaceae archaeon]
MWEKLFVPPLAASLLSYLLQSKVEGRGRKLLTFWASWAAVGSAVHALLGLPLALEPAYPLLALSTGAFMYKGVRAVEDKGPR